MQSTKLFDILESKAVDGVGTHINVDGYENIVIKLSTDGGGDADMRIRAKGSIDKEPPEWQDTQSDLNHWTYIEMVEPDTNESFSGSIGLKINSQDKYILLELNVAKLSWMNLEVSERTAGEVTARAKLFTNQ